MVKVQALSVCKMIAVVGSGAILPIIILEGAGGILYIYIHSKDEELIQHRTCVSWYLTMGPH